MLSSFFLQAQNVVPVTCPVVPRGIVEVRGNRVVAVHPASEKRRLPRNRFFDLGESIVIPGLINAHCHLDYTSMAGVIPPPSSFTSWIHSIQGLKRDWTPQDFRASWLEGARMLVESGVTTVCDIESVWDLVPDIAQLTPLRVISCLEFIDLSHSAEASRLLDKLTQLQRLETSHKWTVGISPHAPYSTTPILLRALAKALKPLQNTVTMHIGESAEEWEMFKLQSGPMHEWLAPQRSMKTCAGKSPVQIVSDSGILSPSFLGVHMNYIDRADAEAFGKSGASIVHCPRSHAYFTHGEFPLDLARKNNIPVCLGTDSLATVRFPKTKAPSLCLFAEMREFTRKNPDVSPREVLEMTTKTPARALGLNGQAGTLSKGAFADLVVLRVKTPASDPYEALLSTEDPRPGVMIDGNWVVPPPELQP